MNDSTTKTCTKCGQTFPATLDYFYKNGACRDGLNTSCKSCKDAQHRNYARDNKQKIADYQREYKVNNAEKLALNRHEYYLANKPYHLEINRQYRRKNKVKLAAKRSIYGKMWRENNKELARNYVRNRRARKRQLQATLTPQDWQACLEYFNYTCAVCGCQLRDLFGNVEPHADHWIPISNAACTGTIPSNIVCLCAPCNHEKSFRLPQQWLEEKYGRRKATEILKRVETYFNSLE